MNHPIIAQENGQARYEQMLQDAADYRRALALKRRNSRVSLWSRLFGKAAGSQQRSEALETGSKVVPA